MAQVDVTQLLTDPDFVDKMQVISRFPRVNSLGENLITEQVLNTIGSVQPASGKTIQRLPEALRVANVMDFFFKGQIVATEPGKYTSILVFKGRRFQVQLIQDWSNWGSGWTQGTCVAEIPA